MHDISKRSYSVKKMGLRIDSLYHFLLNRELTEHTRFGHSSGVTLKNVVGVSYLEVCLNSSILSGLIPSTLGHPFKLPICLP